MFFFFPGSLTLHHWQQLAKPHLATILDPHPGVVTKGFRPLTQDAVYRLSDMEEDEEDEEHTEGVVQEKGAAERSKEEEEEDEEEGGITFNVRCSSTPEERRDRKHSVPPLSPSLSGSPGTPAVSSSVRPDLGLTSTPAASSLSIPGAAAACSLASTTAPSPGERWHLRVTVAHVQFMFLIICDVFSVKNPVKCQSSTFSTYTFTTCRILHPSDVTQVTSRYVQI